MAVVIKNVFLTFLLIKELTESYLENRNKKHIRKNRHEVPEKFKEQIALSEHQKAADYNVTKITVNQFFKLYDLIILLIWTVGGGLNSLDLIARSFNYSPTITGIIFFLGFAAINMILGLPQSIYGTFVIEERFGFNKTTLKTFIMDRVKGIFLGLIIAVPLLYAILWIMQSFESNWWFLAFLLLTTFQLIMMWAYPTLIAPLFNKFSPLEEGDVKKLVLSLLDRTGFKSNGLFVMNASMRSAHGNAYFTGIGKNKRIVFFDTLIKTLEAKEVEAVLAHELGHFKKKHVLKGLVRAIFLSFLGFFILGKLYAYLPFYQGHGVDQASPYMALMLFSMVSGIYLFFLTPISSYISRKYEFEADEFASQHSNALELINALIKLYKDNASTLTPDPLFSSFYHSHPPALTRVKFLESLKK